MAVYTQVLIKGFATAPVFNGQFLKASEMFSIPFIKDCSIALAIADPKFKKVYDDFHELYERVEVEFRDHI